MGEPKPLGTGRASGAGGWAKPAETLPSATSFICFPLGQGLAPGHARDPHGKVLPNCLPFLQTLYCLLYRVWSRALARKVSLPHEFTASTHLKPPRSPWTVSSWVVAKCLWLWRIGALSRPWIPLGHKPVNCLPPQHLLNSCST